MNNVCRKVLGGFTLALGVLYFGGVVSAVQAQDPANSADIVFQQQLSDSGAARGRILGVISLIGPNGEETLASRCRITVNMAVYENEAAASNGAEPLATSSRRRSIRKIRSSFRMVAGNLPGILVDDSVDTTDASQIPVLQMYATATCRTGGERTVFDSANTFGRRIICGKGRRERPASRWVRLLRARLRVR